MTEYREQSILGAIAIALILVLAMMLASGCRMMEQMAGPVAYALLTGPILDFDKDKQNALAEHEATEHAAIEDQIQAAQAQARVDYPDEPEWLTAVLGAIGTVGAVVGHRYLYHGTGLRKSAQVAVTRNPNNGNLVQPRIET